MPQCQPLLAGRLGAQTRRQGRPGQRGAVVGDEACPDPCCPAFSADVDGCDPGVGNGAPPGAEAPCAGRNSSRGSRNTRARKNNTATTKQITSPGTGLALDCAALAVVTGARRAMAAITTQNHAPKPRLQCTRAGSGVGGGEGTREP